MGKVLTAIECRSYEDVVKVVGRACREAYDSWVRNWPGFVFVTKIKPTGVKTDFHFIHRGYAKNHGYKIKRVDDGN